ncbi:MAG TPA: TrbI/VirB10 family protein [Vicinamibacterales bacterium]|nr:TrbI/VirB10 family protein [Vicinamibacterales bacterium]
MPNPTEPRDDTKPPVNPGAIQDWRARPTGVLPRHVQMWVMVIIALVILAIIFLTGHPQPLPRPQAGARPAQATLVPPDHVRSYEQQLAADLARDPQGLAPSSAPVGRATRTAAPVASSSADATAEDQRRRDYQSLFADNIALSRRAADRQPYGERRQDSAFTSSSSPSTASQDVALLEQLLARGLVSPSPTVTPSAPAPALAVAPLAAPSSSERSVAGGETAAPSSPKSTGPIPSGGDTQRLLEGTVIETVLLNRLDGTYSGPVACLVTTPVYSHDRQSVVIPAGARVLGLASPVQDWGDSRLAVSFHRLVLPDGRTFSLDRFKGLGQIGDTGLKDSINRHYLQVFGASLAIGALSGLAQYGSRSTADAYSFGDAYRQAAGSSLAASAGRVLDRYLNVLPTITIREGYRIKVYLTNDLELPVYAHTFGGRP